MDWRQWRQWEFVADMNRDGSITISDVWLWFTWLYFYPGDLIIRTLGNSAIGRFFELSATSFGGFWSGAISFLCWLLLSVWIVAALAESSARREVEARKTPSQKAAEREELKAIELAKPWHQRKISGVVGAVIILGAYVVFGLILTR
jgi:hypothetical protein